GPAGVPLGAPSFGGPRAELARPSERSHLAARTKRAPRCEALPSGSPDLNRGPLRPAEAPLAAPTFQGARSRARAPGGNEQPRRSHKKGPAMRGPSIGVPRSEPGTSPTRRGAASGADIHGRTSRARAPGGNEQPRRSHKKGPAMRGPSIGVPRFELRTSPTRTERATRLRHTPRAAHRVAGFGTNRSHVSRYVAVTDKRRIL